MGKGVWVRGDAEPRRRGWDVWRRSRGDHARRCGSGREGAGEGGGRVGEHAEPALSAHFPFLLLRCVRTVMAALHQRAR